MSSEDKKKKYEEKFTKKNELGIMVTSMKSLRQQLMSIILKLKMQAKSTSTDAGVLDDSITTSSIAMNDINEVMNEVNIASNLQTNAAQKSSESLNSLASKIENSIVQMIQSLSKSFQYLVNALTRYEYYLPPLLYFFV